MREDEMILRTAAKRWIKKSLVETRAIRFLAATTQPAAVILKYHSILDDPEPYANSIGAGIIHPLRLFREQMELLARRYHPVSLADILSFLRGEKELRHGSVAVTFDDGYSDNYEFAAPVLNALGMQAAFYVTVGATESGIPPWYCRLRQAFASTQRTAWFDSVENRARPLGTPQERRGAFLLASGRCACLAGAVQEKILQTIEQELDVEPLSGKRCPMLTWDQVRALRRAGHIVGSHSLTHPNLAQLDAENLRRELEESKRKMEKELDAEVVHLSYPHPILEPHYSKQTIECSELLGYRSAVTGTVGPVRVGQSPLCLRRISVAFRREDFLWNLDYTLLRQSS